MIIVEWSTFEVSHASVCPALPVTTVRDCCRLNATDLYLAADGCLTIVRCWAADDDIVVWIAT